MGIDGTVLDVPDRRPTKRTLAAVAATAATAPPASPQGQPSGTGYDVEGMAVAGYHDSEQTGRATLGPPSPDALLLEDRGFSAKHIGKNCTARGTKLLIRLKDNLILWSIRRSPDSAVLAKIYPSPQDRDKDRDGIIVRVIEYTLNDPERTGHGETHRLATNLFDHTLFLALELACYYHERWKKNSSLTSRRRARIPRRPPSPRTSQPDA